MGQDRNTHRVLVSFVNMTQTRITWEEEGLMTDDQPRVGLWACLSVESIFVISD